MYQFNEKYQSLAVIIRPQLRQLVVEKKTLAFVSQTSTNLDLKVG